MQSRLRETVQTGSTLPIRRLEVFESLGFSLATQLKVFKS